MRICIYGAGATGACFGVQLALAGVDVTLIARGAHLQAMQARGVKLLKGGDERVAHPLCVADPAEAGPQDYVILSVKAHSIAAIAPRLGPLLNDNTTVVTAANGIPWWYFYRLKGEHENRRIDSVDPSGKIWDAIDPARVLGCIVYPATEIVEPGVVRHIENDKLSLGEPDGKVRERTTNLAEAFRNAGFRCRVTKTIRDELWLKLLGNLSFNPISALTLATLDRISTDPDTTRISRLMMREAQSIANGLNATIKLDIERRIAASRRVGPHKTSMLQDLETHRPMEIDALVTAVQELGRLVGVATPTIDVVLSLIQQRGETAGTYTRRT